MARKLPPGFSIESARRAQELMSKSIVREDRLPTEVRRIAGIDIAYRGSVAYGAAVLLDFKTMRPLEESVVCRKVEFPYIPTLLAFREFPVTYAAIKGLGLGHDAIMVNGQGIAHPYRLGLASHVGVVLRKPTIGVAKRRLCGVIGEWRGMWAPLIDGNETIGAVLNIGRGYLFVSIGNMITLETAIRIVLHCLRGHRLPEPLWLAHKLANDAAKGRRKLSVCIWDKDMEDGRRSKPEAQKGL